MIGYARVSTTDQSPEAQAARLREHGCTRVFTDHGVTGIERIPRTHRYQVTAAGLGTAMFLTRVHDRVLQAGLAYLNDPAPSPLRTASRAYQAALDDLAQRAGTAARPLKLDSISPASPVLARLAALNARPNARKSQKAQDAPASRSTTRSTISEPNPAGPSRSVKARQSRSACGARRSRHEDHRRSARADLRIMTATARQRARAGARTPLNKVVRWTRPGWLGRLFAGAGVVPEGGRC